MPTYIFKGRNRMNEVVNGERVADNREALRQILRREQVTLTSVKEKGREIGIPKLSGRKRVNSKDLAIFTRQFSVMIDAGLPLVQCLDILSQHPLNFTKPPSYHPFNRNDVQVANFKSVRRTLRAAERAHHVRPRGHRQLWATEYSWYTNPENPTGVSPMKQAKWIEQGFYLLWKQGIQLQRLALWSPVQSSGLSAGQCVAASRSSSRNACPV